jgi:serine/threonine protein kinase
MTISAGGRLGPYEIISLLGAGGMGEVYKAKDTRLDRTVAIKVLSEHLSDRPELRERFEREARAVASLNHPHICVLHDIGKDQNVDFLVMEYLDGETLSDRLKKGPMPLDQAKLQQGCIPSFEEGTMRRSRKWNVTLETAQRGRAAQARQRAASREVRQLVQ